MAFSMLNAGNWADDIVGLFTNHYNIICMVCLTIGLILLAIECFIPGFGVFGILGIIVSTLSLAFLIILGGTWRQFLFVIGMVIVIATIVILIAIRSARFGALSKSPLVQTETALPEDFSSNEKNYSYLIGKIGVTETVCKPIGKVNIEGQTYSAITNGEYIDKEKEIYVSEVDGTSIIVKER
ncbi:MAG: hypothetical protein IKR12_01790 [Clostridia bacterium]|nr:hypothetical protein [Clostridia bacterium]